MSNISLDDPEPRFRSSLQRQEDDQLEPANRIQGRKTHADMDNLGTLESVRLFLDDGDDDVEHGGQGSPVRSHKNKRTTTSSKKTKKLKTKEMLAINRSARFKNDAGDAAPGSMAGDYHEFNTNNGDSYNGESKVANVQVKDETISARIGRFFVSALSVLFRPCSLAGECCVSCAASFGRMPARQKMLLCYGTIFAAIVVTGAMLIVTRAEEEESSSKAATISDPGGEVEEFPLGHDRFVDSREYILGADLTDMDLLDTKGSAQNKALWWIASSDDAQVECGSADMFERYVLATFFFSTYVASDYDDMNTVQDMLDLHEWKNNENWMTEKDVCAWYGVHCSKGKNKHVIGLSLPANNVRGTMPCELEALKNLKVLDLSENHLYDKISPALGKLQHLEKLYLNNNDFNGPIPGAIGGCKALKELRVNANKLQEKIPWQIRQLTNLEQFHMEGNEIEGVIPKGIASLPKLHVFQFFRNKLKGKVPEALCTSGPKNKFLAGDCSEEGGTIKCDCCKKCFP